MISCHWSPPYPFTAPAVSPATIRRWKISTMMTIGMVTTTAAAAICAGRVAGTATRRWKNASAAGTVRAAVGRRERDGEQEVVPREDEDEDRRR